MNEALSIPAGALRAVWVFAIDLRGPELKAFANEERSPNGERSHWPLRDALGVDFLDPEFIEVFDAETLREIGFTTYLTDANGMDESTVAPDAAKLDALTGPVLVVYSRALAGRDAALAPRAPLRLIGRYSERSSTTGIPMPPAKAAKAEAREQSSVPEAKPSKLRIGFIVLAASLLTWAIAAAVFGGNG